MRKPPRKPPTEGTPYVSQSQKNEGRNALRITQAQHGEKPSWATVWPRIHGLMGKAAEHEGTFGSSECRT